MDWLFGFTFDECGLDCHVLARAFACESLRQGAGTEHMAALYWEMHYPDRDVPIGWGSVPFLPRFEEESVLAAAGFEARRLGLWDGRLDSLAALRAPNAALLVPSAKAAFVKQYVGATGFDLHFVAECSERLLYLRGNSQTLPLAYHAKERAVTLAQATVARPTLGSAQNIGHVTSLFSLFGDVYVLFSANPMELHDAYREMLASGDAQLASLQQVALLDPDAAPGVAALVRRHLTEAPSDRLEIRLRRKLDHLQALRSSPGHGGEQGRAFMVHHLRSASLAFGAASTLLEARLSDAELADLGGLLRGAMRAWESIVARLHRGASVDDRFPAIVDAERRLLRAFAASLADDRAVREECLP